ncbi:MAG: LysM peptidoglycan-binding domain-containing protein [Candidatus Caldatribacteriota bacterium]|nr:LysM peptidoglycan-binding domain-containing protein [Atribacterota bacterium]
MSRSITIIFIILIVIIAGFAYLNYNRLNQIQSDLLQKEALLEESEQLIEEQEASLAQLEEKVKEVLEKEEYLSEEAALEKREDELQKQLTRYQEELQTVQQKLEELIQQSKMDNEDIVLLRQEKDKLEALLAERETQWQKREEENQAIITSLQNGIQQYESEIKAIKDRVLTLEQYLASETSKRKDLEQEIAKYEENIALLEEQLVLKQDDEAQVQQISQLQLNKKQLEEEIAKKDSTLLQIQREYEDLQNQIASYEQKIANLQEEISQAVNQKEILAQIEDNLSQLKEEKNRLEALLQEKETQWLEKEQIHKDTIAQLQEEVKKYELNLKEIGNEMLALREDLIKENSLNSQLAKIEQEKEALERLLLEKEEEWNKQNQENRQLITYLKDHLARYQEEIEMVKLDSSLFKEEIATQLELQQQNIAQIRDREEQISELTSQIEQYMQKIEDYEKTVAEVRMKLQEQEDISYQEQQSLIDTIHSLVEERDFYQNSINQCYAQVSKLQLEIAELKNKIGTLEKEEAQYYEVKRGDCLWTIAKDRYNEGIAWIKIFKANQDQIENPDLIYPYQQFILPE